MAAHKKPRKLDVAKMIKHYEKEERRKRDQEARELLAAFLRVIREGERNQS